MHPTSRFWYKEGTMFGSSKVPFALCFTLISNGSYNKKKLLEVIDKTINSLWQGLVSTSRVLKKNFYIPNGISNLHLHLFLIYIENGVSVTNSSEAEFSVLKKVFQYRNSDSVPPVPLLCVGFISISYRFCFCTSSGEN